MKVTGFSFIKNAVQFQYPIVEAVQSILPLCDEVVVAVGDSDDNTRELVSSINPKVRIVDTIWDNSLRQDGKVLAAETNKAFAAVDSDADWCVYIQGDEVMHDGYYDEIKQAMERWKDAPEVDGLLFKYRHFYGSFDYIGISSKWYRAEVRIIKNNKSFYSYKDAQGFRKRGDVKLNVKPLNAYIHHYGWVREPKAMMAKNRDFGRHWTTDWEASDLRKTYVGEFDYSGIDALQKFEGTHPKVMQPRIEKANWHFEHDLSQNKIKLKDRFKLFMEKYTGVRPFDFRNYRIV